MTNEKCEKCHGKGSYMYDENHAKPCEVCCTHSQGWCKLEEHYGNDNGKYACKNGCGTVVDKDPQAQVDTLSVARRYQKEVFREGIFTR